LCLLLSGVPDKADCFIRLYFSSFDHMGTCCDKPRGGNYEAGTDRCFFIWAENAHNAFCEVYAHPEMHPLLLVNSTEHPNPLFILLNTFLLSLLCASGFSFPGQSDRV